MNRLGGFKEHLFGNNIFNIRRLRGGACVAPEMDTGQLTATWTPIESSVTVLLVARGNLLQVRTLVAYAMVLLAVAADAAPAHAEVRVEGSASSVRIDARNATRADILAALAQRFDMRVRGAVPDGRINVALDGPLRRVIARVLAGYNYVIGTRGGRLDVLVLDMASPNAVAPPVYRVPTYPAAHLRRDE